MGETFLAKYGGSYSLGGFAWAEVWDSHTEILSEVDARGLGFLECRGSDHLMALSPDGTRVFGVLCKKRSRSSNTILEYDLQTKKSINSLPFRAFLGIRENNPQSDSERVLSS